MKLSKDTLDTLKNFATINTNILVREGNTLSTISTGKNIFARSEIKEDLLSLNTIMQTLTLLLALLIRVLKLITSSNST